MSIPDSIERVLELAHPPEKVWAALTTAEGLGGWFGSRAEINDLRPGGEARVWWNQQDGHTLAIQVVEPPRRFAYTWAIDGLPTGDPRRTRVEFTLESTGTGTRLTVRETGFARMPEDLAIAYEDHTTGWRTELTELAEYLDAAS